MSASSTDDASQSAPPGQLLCEFCGDFPAVFACASASGGACRRRLCRHCDTVWHGHPHRRGHERSPLHPPPPPPAASANVVGVGKWTCPHCTFENAAGVSTGPSDGRRLVCATCHRSASCSSSSGVVKDASRQVACPMCTLLNPASAAACQACEAHLRPPDFDDCFTDDESDEELLAAERRAADMAEERRLLDVVQRRQEELDAAHRRCQRQQQRQSLRPPSSELSSGGSGGSGRGGGSGVPSKVARCETSGWGRG